MDQNTDDEQRRRKNAAADASKKPKDDDETKRDGTKRAADQDDDNSEELAQSDEFESEMKALEESGEDTEELRRQYLLTRFWQAARGFWGRRGRRIAWILSAALLAI